jgi:hypothetical protein
MYVILCVRADAQTMLSCVQQRMTAAAVLNDLAQVLGPVSTLWLLYYCLV